MMAGFRSVNQPFRPCQATAPPCPRLRPPYLPPFSSFASQPSGRPPEKALSPLGGFGPEAPAPGLHLQVLSSQPPLHFLFGEELPKIWVQGTRSPRCSWCFELRAKHSPGHGSLNDIHRVQHEPPLLPLRPLPTPPRPFLEHVSRECKSEACSFVSAFSPPSFSGDRRVAEGTPERSDQEPLSFSANLSPVPMAMEPLVGPTLVL